MKPIIKQALILAAALLFAGCAGVERRIEDNQAAFNSFPPEIQKSIKNETVHIGYTREMVRIALGKPDHRLTKTTEAGTTEIWLYTAYSWNEDHTTRPLVVGIRDWWHPYTIPQDDRRQEYIRLRIDFIGERVSSIEKAEEHPPMH